MIPMAGRKCEVCGELEVPREPKGEVSCRACGQGYEWTRAGEGPNAATAWNLRLVLTDQQKALLNHTRFVQPITEKHKTESGSDPAPAEVCGTCSLWVELAYKEGRCPIEFERSDRLNVPYNTSPGFTACGRYKISRERAVRPKGE